jgi:hypothetical protein
LFVWTAVGVSALQSSFERAQRCNATFNEDTYSQKTVRPVDSMSCRYFPSRGQLGTPQYFVYGQNTQEGWFHAPLVSFLAPPISFLSYSSATIWYNPAYEMISGFPTIGQPPIRFFEEGKDW